MKNKKAIIINGLTRSGTNIVWNLTQSHPQVCSPIRETGKLLYQNKLSKLWWKLVGSYPHAFLPVEQQLTSHMDEVFFQNKLKNSQHAYYSFKFENQQYTPEEVAQSVLCLKSVDQDIRLSHYFDKMYKEAYFIGVIRNGYAFCEGWVRRGRSARAAGNSYRVFVGMMLEDSKRYEHYKLVRFEDTVSDPFATASGIYQFARLTPEQVKGLRLKSKAILAKDGKHKPKFGELNSIHWFNEQNIGDILDPKVNQVQADKLKPNDRRLFEREAGPILQELGYMDESVAA